MFVLRNPLSWLAFIALAVCVLLALERTGTAAAPVTVIDSVDVSHKSKHKDKGAAKHCNDGKGNDANTPACGISHG